MNSVTGSSPDARVVAGRISAVFGVRGWVKVHSYTQPIENIMNYRPWQLCRQGRCVVVEVAEGRRHGKGLIARLEGVEDRDAALELVGQQIEVPRAALPALAAGDYYWSDLQGLVVVTTEGVALGRVDHLLETGANDVLVVVDADRHQRLIPYIKGQVVTAVDLAAGTLTVDWDPEF
ncbi:MAG TPA: ribosome maturation factor RimM [Gammaproteobacteria bacterium]|nr:ribosome maturation factor RimM [Gammaproteobacteria bacterium]